MGNQPKPHPETSKASPMPATVGDLDDGGSPPAIEFCLRQHSLRVEFSTAGAASPGEEVRLLLASPPQVLCGARQVGQVRDSLAGGMSRCLLDGYEMAGVVDFVDLTGKSGQITVCGREGG
jgi:hypothetical protein